MGPLFTLTYFWQTQTIMTRKKQHPIARECKKTDTMHPTKLTDMWMGTVVKQWSLQCYPGYGNKQMLQYFRMLGFKSHGNTAETGSNSAVYPR